MAAATSTFSAITFYKKLTKLFESSDIPKDIRQGLVIQYDALGRLEDEDVVEDQPFAVFHYKKVESDAALGFDVAFLRNAVAYNIGSEIEGWCKFDQFENESIAAQQAVMLITMLLNGQISILTSLRSQRVYAVELLLYKDLTRPVSVLTDAHFPLLKRSPADLETVEKKNHALSEKLSVPDNFFLYPRQEDGRFPKTGRTHASLDFTPLSRTEWENTREERIWTGTGKKDSSNIWSHIYKQWEFWVLMGLEATVGYSAYRLHILPQFLLDHTTLLYVANIFLVYLIMPPILQDKQRRRALRAENEKIMG